MINIVLKDIGPNKVKIISIVREIVGVELREAEDIVGNVEMGNEYTITNISAERVQTIIDDFTREGALVVKEGYEEKEFHMTTDESISDSISDEVNFQEEIGGETEKNMAESESNENKHVAYQSKVLPDEVSQLGRQETMDVLLEIQKIAEESENYDNEMSSLTIKIKNEQKKADELRNQVSFSTGCIMYGSVVFILFCGWAVDEFFSSIVIGIILWIILSMTIKKADLRKNAEKNNAEADDYICQKVKPLEDRLQEVYALKNDLDDSGKITWAIDVVGSDMFYSVCINDLYNLIQSRRADSLKEALNKYDDEQHKAHMEEMQRAIQNASEVAAAESVKQTAYAKDTSKSAHQTATAAKATAYHTRQTARNTRRFR